MKISQLLGELNISLEILKSYEQEANFEFLFLDQILDDKVVEKVKKIHNKNLSNQKLANSKNSEDKTGLGNLNRPIKKRRRVIESQENSLVGAQRFQILENFYNNKKCYKINAKVKWYYDYSKSGEYGFLTCNGLPDIFFRGNVVKGLDPRILRENDDVLVEILLKDIEKRDKLNAFKVNKLEHEEDLIFLLHQSAIEGKHRYFLQTLQQIEAQSGSLSKKTKEELKNGIDRALKNTFFSIEQAIFLYEFCDKAAMNVSEDILNKVKDYFSLQDQFQLWLNTTAIFTFSHIKEAIVNHVASTNSYSFLNKLKNEEVAIILKAALERHLTNETSSSEGRLIEILNAFKAFEIEVDYSIFNDQHLFLLWENKAIKFSPIDAIYNRIVELWFNGSEGALEQISSVFNKASEQELRDLFSKTHYNKELIKNEKEFKLIRFFIDNVKPKDLANDFFKIINSKSPDYIKLQWFIWDYTNELDYHATVIYTGLLTSEMQKLYFKKVLMLIEIKQLHLSLDDLNKITTIDYQTSEYAKEIAGVGLDFTLSIILKLVTDLSNYAITKRQTIFEIIANQIRHPKDLLVIDGFFEKCSGRTILKSIEKDVLGDGNIETIYYLEQKKYFPRFSTFCDGRKAIITNSEELSLCKKSGFEFWWCENNQCYDACRKQFEPTDWKRYTLEDVLRILSIPYSNKQYEILLNIINRVNRFLEHLKCRSCSTILRPRKKSNYAFYGVTKFYCCNDLCDEQNKDIYLSHCLNGKCEDIIDSRDSVKCINEGHDADCGWYICDNCYACCSTEKLKNRKNILELTGQEYKCHVEGHLNKGVICCTKCGNETEKVKSSKKLYDEQLKWFISQKDIHPNITNSGKRKDGKYWFLWAQGRFTHEQYRDQLKSMLKSGFNIPDYNMDFKNPQLIGESFNDVGLESEVFKCTKCENVINLMDKEHFDFHRLNAIKSFHNQIFPTFNIR